ncbi:hypothetical protein DFH08DRAFT_1028433 [Mycena albidolilacea]|uniref:Uncharacterized protein n=1 Tax=Mycena albidolilacea TaxID=1033008 RepID=A0AAD6ZJ36_9AGAR|nr:hypothetical protein DFH08DRAFT_1028433 [Mycena albidolilacea]
MVNCFRHTVPVQQIRKFKILASESAMQMTMDATVYTLTSRGICCVRLCEKIILLASWRIVKPPSKIYPYALPFIQFSFVDGFRLVPGPRTAESRAIVSLIARPGINPLVAGILLFSQELARASRAALDFLWREQETLVNVLKCLPAHLWEEAAFPLAFRYTRRPKFRIIRPIQPTDWEVPSTYALRIQRLELQSCYMNEELYSVADVFETIGTGLPRVHLCPNLRSLMFNVGQDTLFPYIRLFLGPKIVVANISLPTSRFRFQVCIRHLELPIRYLLLQKLCVSGGFRDDFHGALSDIIFSLDRIEELSIDDHELDRAAVEHLSQLPSLTSLTLEVLPDLGPSSRSLVDWKTPLFSALRDLYFDNTNIEFATDFVDCASNEIDDPSTVCESGKPLNHYALETRHIGLPETCSGMETMPPAPSNYLINGPILASLFCFKNLTEINLEPPVGFDMDDALAWHVARAWPKFTSLCLTHVAAWPSSVRRALPRVDVPHHRLRCCHNVSASPMIHSSPVAQFLSWLFPNLAGISTLNEWRWDDGRESGRTCPVHSMDAGRKDSRPEFEVLSGMRLKYSHIFQTQR